MAWRKHRISDDLQLNFAASAAPLPTPDDKRRPGRPAVATEQFTLRINADMRKQLAGLAAREQEATGKNVTLQQVALKILGDVLTASETAPVSPPASATPPPPVPEKRRNGRSLRASGRTHPFATRIKLETHHEMLDIAERDGITLGELIERAIEAYDRTTT